jgi:hypothetical protein
MLRFSTFHLIGGLAATGLLLASLPGGQDAEQVFHKAYFLEHEAGDLNGALELYRGVAGDSSADKALRARAKTLAASISEELAAGDFASLVPETTILFAEISRPGKQLEQLLGQLGLLGEAHRVVADQIKVSPLLVENLLGLRGAAVAVTEVGANGQPNGVVLLHPGDLDLLRGLIETALPAGGVAVDPIGGFPTWSIAGKAFVCMTSRLVIASPDPSQIEGVIERLSGGMKSSLASSAKLNKALGKQRDGLLSFYVNADPLKGMMRAHIGQLAKRDPGVAVAASLLDLDSFESLSGRIGVNQDGLSLNAALQLADGHRNVVFNLLRKPTVGRDTLSLVPSGAAFFFATGFNQAGSVTPIGRDGSEPVVTLLDIGREVFGNVIDVAVFGLPPTPGAQGPIPDVAAVVRVNDVERSRALWNLALGIGSQAASGRAMTPERFEIGEFAVERYEIQGVPVFMASGEHELVISPSRAAIERALASRKDSSVTTDRVFAKALDVIDHSPTMILAACPGRCAQIARGFMPKSEAQKIEPFARLLDSTVVSVAVQHSDTRLAFGARVHGIPDVSGMVSQAAQGWKHGGGAATVRASERAPVPVQASSRTASAEPDAMRERFDQLALRDENPEAARASCGHIREYVQDAQWLNNFAWALLTEEPYGGRYDDQALLLSKRSNELSEHSSWYFLDTLALAYFRSGETDAAIEVQKKAVELAAGDPQLPAAVAALERYQAALESSPVVRSGGGDL